MQPNHSYVAWFCFFKLFISPVFMRISSLLCFYRATYFDLLHYSLIIKSMDTFQLFTLILSIIGSVGTLVSLLQFLLKYRIKLNAYFVFLHYVPANNAFNGYLIIENRTNLPIIVTSISIKNNNYTYEFSHIPVLVREDKKRNNCIYSEKIPIDFLEYQSLGGYFSSKECPHAANLNEPLTLEIRTNRRYTFTFSFHYKEVPHDPY